MSGPSQWPPRGRPGGARPLQQLSWASSTSRGQAWTWLPASLPGPGKGRREADGQGAQVCTGAAHDRGQFHRPRKAGTTKDKADKRHHIK